MRAAFPPLIEALIEAQAEDGRNRPCSVEALHAFALAERAALDDAPLPAGPRRKTKRRRAAAA